MSRAADDRATVVLLLAATVSAGVGLSAPLWWRLPAPSPLFWLEMASGLGLLAAGYIASRWRSARQIARLLLLTTIAYFLAYLATSGSDLAFTIGAVDSGLWLAIGGHLVVSFPDGRLGTRLEKGVVLAGYAWTIVIRLLFLVYDPRQFGCSDCPTNLLLLAPNPELARAILAADTIVPTIVTSLVVVAIARRWLRATRPARRVLTPVFLTFAANVAATGGVAFASGLVIAGVITPDQADAAWIVHLIGLLLFPIGMIAGILRSVMARSAVGNLLVRIGQGRTPQEIGRDVAWALGDPSATIAFGRAGDAAFADAAGTQIDLAATEPDAVTYVEGADGTVIALLHDPSLRRDQPELLEAVAAATRLALENERLQTEVKLSREIPQGLAERLLREGGRIGQSQTLTISVLMSDIRGYTTLAEQADPHALASQLNEHRAAMNRVIVAHGGTVMQFVGDMVFAVFGAPLSMDDHAPRAVDAALEMQAAQRSINESWSTLGRPSFGLGIAVTTGDVAAALLGSEEHVEYSVAGDVVNLAQRIQQWAGPGEVIVAEATLRQMGRPTGAAEPLPVAQVKGRGAPVAAYRILEGSPANP